MFLQLCHVVLLLFISKVTIWDHVPQTSTFSIVLTVFVYWVETGRYLCLNFQLIFQLALPVLIQNCDHVQRTHQYFLKEMKNNLDLIQLH